MGEHSNKHPPGARPAPATRQRRLAVVGLTYPYRGGISHYSTLLVRALRRRHRVDFITLRRQYPGLLFPGQSQFDYSATTLEEANDRIVDSLNPWTWYQAARALNAAGPELIIIQWWHPFFAPAFGTLVRFLRPALQRRVCFLCHNVLPHESNPLQSALTRYAFSKAPFFIVHSEEDRRELETLMPGAAVRRGAHPTYEEFAATGSRDKATARRELGLDPTQNTILFFGLVRAYKGLRYLIPAMPRVIGELNCQLLIVGEFYDDPKPYMRLIEELDLATHIKVVNRYIPNEEVSVYFNSADVVVLPYVSATQSGIVQIAFGLETPVITTDVGGLPEAVDHGRTGLVVGSQDAEQLADAILEYYAGNHEAAFRAEIIRQAKRFDWSQELDHIEAFLDSA